MPKATQKWAGLTFCVAVAVCSVGCTQAVPAPVAERQPYGLRLTYRIDFASRKNQGKLDAGEVESQLATMIEQRCVGGPMMAPCYVRNQGSGMIAVDFPGQAEIERARRRIHGIGPVEVRILDSPSSSAKSISIGKAKMVGDSSFYSIASQPEGQVWEPESPEAKSALSKLPLGLGNRQVVAVAYHRAGDNYIPQLVFSHQASRKLSQVQSQSPRSQLVFTVNNMAFLVVDAKKLHLDGDTLQAPKLADTRLMRRLSRSLALKPFPVPIIEVSANQYFADS